MALEPGQTSQLPELSSHLSRPDDLAYRATDGSLAASARSLRSGRINSAWLDSYLLDVLPSDVGTSIDAAVSHRLVDLGVPATSWVFELSEDELASTFWELLCRAVELCVADSGRVGVALGGIDSSAILAALCEVRPAREIVAITCDYDDGADQPFARELCTAYGVELVLARVVDALPHLRRTLLLDGLPSMGWGVCVELYLQELFSRRGVDRYLTGIPGDDLLGGERSTLAWWIRQDPRGLAQTLRELDLAKPHSYLARVRAHILRPHLLELAPDALLRWKIERDLPLRAPWFRLRARAPLTDSLVARIRVPRTPSALALRREPLFRQILAGRVQVVAEGGMSRADPYFESTLSSFATSLSILRLVAGGQDRGAFRRSLPKRMPVAVRNRTTKARMQTQLDTLGLQTRHLFADLVNLDRLRRMGLVDTGAFRTAFDTLGPHHHAVWAALSAEAYMREVA
jgi:hypothetical protein